MLPCVTPQVVDVTLCNPQVVDVALCSPPKLWILPVPASAEAHTLMDLHLAMVRKLVELYPGLATEVAALHNSL